MEHKKIIVSSKSLFNYLRSGLESADFKNDDLLYLGTDECVLSIPMLIGTGVYFEPCYHKNDISCTVKYSQIVRLKMVLQLLQEQPVVLTIDPNNNCIHISDAVI